MWITDCGNVDNLCGYLKEHGKIRGFLKKLSTMKGWFMEDIFDLFEIENVDLSTMSTITLAYIGDAVHTFLVRKYFLETKMQTVNNLHINSSKYCSAKGQAKALDLIIDVLSAEEKDLIRRTRNAKTHKPPKNCDLEIYKKATCFEALIGYLYIKKDYKKLKEIFLKSV